MYMADFIDEAFEAAKTGVYFWKDAKALKYTVAKVIFETIAGALFMLTALVAAIGFLLPFIRQMTQAMPEAQQFVDALMPLSAFAVPAALAAFLLLIADVLVVSLLSGKILARGLELQGFTSAKVNWGMAARLFLAAIWVFLLALVPIHKKKTLVIQLALYAVALVALLAFGMVGIVLAVLCILAAFVSIYYNFLQLSFTSQVMLSQDKGIHQSALESVRLIAGKTTRYFGISLVAGICIGLAVWLLFAIVNAILAIPLSLGGGLVISVAGFYINSIGGIAQASASLFATAVIYSTFYQSTKSKAGGKLEIEEEKASAKMPLKKPSAKQAKKKPAVKKKAAAKKR